MKIKLLTSIAGFDADGAVIAYSDGDVVEWADEAEARRLIAAGLAEASGEKDKRAASQKNGASKQ